METADVSLLIVYAAVVGYFLRRYVLFRKLPSLGIALLPTGWLLLALESGIRSQVMATMKWVGVLFGVLLMISVTHADKIEKK